MRTFVSAIALNQAVEHFTLHVAALIAIAIVSAFVLLIGAIEKKRIAGLMLRRDWGQPAPWPTWPKEGAIDLHAHELQGQGGDPGGRQTPGKFPAAQFRSRAVCRKLRIARGLSGHSVALPITAWTLSPRCQLQRWR